MSDIFDNLLEIDLIIVRTLHLRSTIILRQLELNLDFWRIRNYVQVDKLSRIGASTLGQKVSVEWE